MKNKKGKKWSKFLRHGAIKGKCARFGTLLCGSGMRARNFNVNFVLKLKLKFGDEDDLQNKIGFFFFTPLRPR